MFKAVLLILAKLVLLVDKLLMMLLVPLVLLLALLIHVENYPDSSRLFEIPWIALELLVCGNKGRFSWKGR